LTGPLMTAGRPVGRRGADVAAAPAVLRVVAQVDADAAAVGLAVRATDVGWGSEAPRSGGSQAQGSERRRAQAAGEAAQRFPAGEPLRHFFGQEIEVKAGLPRRVGSPSGGCGLAWDGTGGTGEAALARPAPAGPRQPPGQRVRQPLKP